MAKSLFNINEQYPIQNWLPKSGLQYSNPSVVFKQPTIEPIIENGPSTDRVNQIKGIYNNAFMSNKMKTDLRTKSRLDAGMAEPTKAISDVVDKTNTSFKAPSIIGMANIATGVSSLINTGISFAGAMDARKMQPTLMKPYVPTEAKLVADNTSAIQTAGQENIEKSIAANKADVTRKGIVGMNGVFVGKETEALNQLGGQLAQYRTGIDTANAQIENSVNAQNKQAEMGTEQFNASTQNQFDQYKSGLIGMGMKNATDAIQTGTETIFGNIANSKQMKISSISTQLAQINKLMTENPNWKDSYPNPSSLFEKKALLEKQLEEENKSLIG